MATGATGLQLISLRLDGQTGKLKSKVQAIKNIMYEGISPCPWADYLKCIPQTVESVDETLDEAKDYMREHRPILTGQSGGKHKGGDVLDRYLASLDSAIELGRNVQTRVGDAYANIQTERMKAGAAISYISRLFVLGLEDNVDTLRDYSRDKHEMELDDVMYKMATYIKNTRPETTD